MNTTPALAFAESTCRDIYIACAAFYAANTILVDGEALGFKILYGPPHVEPPIAFLGYQPGGRVSALDNEAETPASWPPQCEYATEPWHLAAKMRKIWEPALLRRCVGLNVNFFRAPSRRVWQNLPSETRSPAEELCKEAARRLLAHLNPRMIILIGLTTVADFVPDGRAHRSAKGRTLIRRGELWGHSACAIAHLSGARLSTSDMMDLKRLLPMD